MDNTLEERLLHCIDLLYESVLDPKAWSKALHAVSELLNGNGGLFIAFDHHSVLTRMDTADIPPEALAVYHLLYPQDCRVHAVQALPAYSIFNDATLPNRKAFERTDLFHLVLKKFDVPNHVLTVIPQPQGVSAFVVQRAASTGPATAKEENLLRHLTPHISRCLTLRRTLGNQRSSTLELEDILNQLPYGVAVLNAKGEVERMSESLLAMQRQYRGLGYYGGQLHANVPREDRMLQKIIDQALRREVISDFGGTLQISTGAGTLLQIFASPLPARDGAPARCLLLVKEAQMPPVCSSLTLKQRYQLTSAEARLAQHMAGGKSLQEAAQLLGLRVNTCKSQLKSVYQKVGCRNRSELTRALLVNR